MQNLGTSHIRKNTLSIQMNVFCVFRTRQAIYLPIFLIRACRSIVIGFTANERMDTRTNELRGVVTFLWILQNDFLQKKR